HLVACGRDGRRRERVRHAAVTVRRRRHVVAAEEERRRRRAVRRHDVEAWRSALTLARVRERERPGRERLPAEAGDRRAGGGVRRRGAVLLQVQDAVAERRYDRTGRAGTDERPRGERRRGRARESEGGDHGGENDESLHQRLLESGSQRFQVLLPENGRPDAIYA